MNVFSTGSVGCLRTDSQLAIPAVFAYNTFTRRNRLWLARLDAFAHDLYVLITVGMKDDRQDGVVRTLRAVTPN